MKISEVKKKFKNTWVLAEVLKMNKLNQPVEVKPIIANKDRNKIYDKIATLPRGTKVATLFTGKVSGNFLFHADSKI